jgi:hypothetical protein
MTMIWSDNVGTSSQVTISVGQQSKEFLLRDLDKAGDFILSETNYDVDLGYRIADLIDKGDFEGEILIYNDNDEPIHVDGKPITLGHWTLEEVDVDECNCSDPQCGCDGPKRLTREFI